jgi:Flp pilus assembly protein TadD
VIESRVGAAEEGIFDEDDADLADNQEFDHALSAGTEALHQGNPAEARTALEKAMRYKPRNQRARNLLGLALFKLGELTKAEEIYRSLIEDHPADPTLRVNLGLVFLKANASSDAVRCFETALDLAADHQKAQNYLGLALAQKGELARAREWFLKAGNEAMADRMTQGLQLSPLRDVAQAAADALAAEKPFQPAVESEPASGPAKKRDTLEMARPAGMVDPQPAAAPPVGTRWVATRPSSATAPPIAPQAESTPAGRVIPNLPEPTQPPAATPAEAASEASAPAPPEPLPSMSEYTSARRLTMPAGDGGGFAIGPSEVLVHVRGEMLTRLDGLVASWGSVSMKPELKRFRGKATDKPFGDGARRMLRATGEGRFVISREGRQFTALELGDEPAYFREETLFSFEESILFENGRVPSKAGSDLHLVHLRGRGRLLLVTAGVPKSVDVLRGEALRIPMDQLVGWHGPLIQPRLVPIVEEAPELGVALELAGEGRALIDVPPGR